MNTQKMKAIISTKYGGPDVLQLQEVQKPRPKNNEVLIKIHAASVSRAATMMRTGKPYIGRLFLGLQRPKNRIPGTGFAGEIEALGPDVTAFKIGDKVFGESIAHFGTQAEYLCLREDGILLKKPENMSYAEAAPICDGPLTVMNFLKGQIDIQPGQRILINGASGSLGTAAVQIAKYYGAQVTGVCSKANFEMVRSLGADQLIDYNTTDFTKSGQKYNFIFDTVGLRSFKDCKKVLTDRGIYLSPVLSMSLLGQVLWTSMVGRKKAKFSATGAIAVSKLKYYLQEIKEIWMAGQLKTVIDRSYELRDISAAHRYIDEGHKKGNVVLQVVRSNG